MDEAILIVRGRSRFWQYFLTIGLMAVLFASLRLRHDSVFQALPIGIQRILAIRGVWIAATMGSITVASVAFGFFVWPRVGWAEFYPDRVVLTKDFGYSHVLPWTALEGFRDHSSSYVQLVRKKRGFDWQAKTVGSIPLWVPTLTEADRLRVLDLLQQRGLPRIER